MQSTHGNVAGIIGHHKVIRGAGQAGDTPRYVFGTQAGAIDAIHMHRVRGIVQGAECDVTCSGGEQNKEKESRERERDEKSEFDVSEIIDKPRRMPINCNEIESGEEQGQGQRQGNRAPGTGHRGLRQRQLRCLWHILSQPESVVRLRNVGQGASSSS